MGQTPILNIDYPDEDSKPYWSQYVAFAESLENWFLALLEESTFALVGGGDFVLSGNLFSWSEDMQLVSTRTGERITILAGNVVLGDGNVGSVTNVSQRPIQTQMGGPIEASPSGAGWNKTKIPLFYRLGQNVYLVSQRLGIDNLTVEP